MTQRICILAIFIFFLLHVEQLEDKMYHPMVEDFFAIATIAQEAIGESYEGKVAVAEVIRNRAKQKYSSDGTIIGTVLRAWQFSGWNPERLENGKLKPLDVRAYLARAYKQVTQANTALIDDCIKAWEMAKQGSNTINGAVLYYAPAVVGTPNWARPEHAVQVAEVGGHTFFTPKRT